MRISSVDNSTGRLIMERAWDHIAAGLYENRPLVWRAAGDLIESLWPTPDGVTRSYQIAQRIRRGELTYTDGIAHTSNWEATTTTDDGEHTDFECVKDGALSIDNVSRVTFNHANHSAHYNTQNPEATLNNDEYVHSDDETYCTWDEAVEIVQK